MNSQQFRQAIPKYHGKEQAVDEKRANNTIQKKTNKENTLKPPQPTRTGNLIFDTPENSRQHHPAQ